MGQGWPQFDFTLSARQSRAWELLHSPEVEEVLYGGGKGGGKSVFGCFWAYMRCLELIEELRLKPGPHPIPVGWIGRKRFKDFGDTTLETWKRFLPRANCQIKEQAAEIIIADTVKIIFGGLDQPQDVDKFNSAEYAFFFVDQAEETSESDIAGLRASLRLVINGRKPQYKGLWTANPGQCWLKQAFITRPRPGHVFVRALPTDNPWLGSDYVARLRKSFEYRPELLEAYLHGSWDAFEGADQIIKERWVRQAQANLYQPEAKRRLISVDVARFGDDETVCYYMENTRIEHQEIYGQKDTMHTANLVFRMYHDRGEPTVGVDVNGVGAGVYDRLVEMGCNCVPIDSASKSTDERFGNLRAEMWWKAGEAFAAGEVALNLDDEPLVTQLTTPRYYLRNGMIYVESKDDLKTAKRLGRSPDRGDAYIMGLHLLAQIEPEGRRTRDRFAMAGGSWRTA